MIKKSSFHSFSYAEYKNILQDIQKTRKLVDFLEVSENVPFVVLRHDVENTPIKAYALAQIESEMNIKSSYFFQLRSPGYNILSSKNRKIVQGIADMGHYIGLHYYVEKRMPQKDIEKDILLDISTMNRFFPFHIHRFSIHRPHDWILRMNIMLPDIINTYSEPYFHFIENLSNTTWIKNGEGENHFRIKYISDSGHVWKYGYPDTCALQKYPKVQLLTHPYSWSEKGLDRKENFEHIVNIKKREFLSFLQNENKNCPLS